MENLIRQTIVELLPIQTKSNLDDDGRGGPCDLDSDGDGTHDRSQRFPEGEQTIY